MSMKLYNTHERKALFYAIQDTDGTPLDLMNLQTFKDGRLDSVTTFIGRHDRDEYIRVADALNLSAPGAAFSYSRFVRQQARCLDDYIGIYHRCLSGKAHPGGAYGAGDRELTPEEELIETLRWFHNQR